MKRRIFIASSREGLPVARAIQANLESAHEPTIWTQDSFPPGKSVIDALEEVLDTSDAGVFLLTPDDLVNLRNRVQPTARDNVIFEMGLFIGRMGRDRTFMVVPRSATGLHRPSDLEGVLAAEYDDGRLDGNLVAAVATACDQVCHALAEADRRRAQTTSENPLYLGLSELQERMSRTAYRLLTREPSTMFDESLVRGIRGSLAIRLGSADLTVRFGRIETYDAEAPGSVVALPANEFFDDDCINDTGSSLGAYIQHAFRGQVPELARLVSLRRRQLPHTIVESEAGCFQESHGIGKCLYLERPLGTNRKIALVSVTTKRAGRGLRCEPHYLYAAVREINKVVNDYRLSELTLPVMGSGHGGLPGELALMHILLAISSIFNDLERSHMRAVNIVVHQRDARAEPAISRGVVMRTLALVANASR